MFEPKSQCQIKLQPPKTAEKRDKRKFLNVIFYVQKRNKVEKKMQNVFQINFQTTLNLQKASYNIYIVFTCKICFSSLILFFINFILKTC